MKGLFFTLVFSSLIIFTLSTDFPFRNTSLSWDERVTDLVWRLTLEELVEQMAYGGGVGEKPCPGIPRLNIQPYNFDTECLRGVVNMPSTSFPQSVGLAASFSFDAVKSMAGAVGVEARAFYNNARKLGEFKNMMGSSCLAPFINIVRHPLWGRIQEVYGEDPYLSGMMAAAYVKGLQGDNPHYVLANSGCKVVDVHSGPEDIPVSRFSFNAVVTERDMRLTFLPNFKMCIKAGTMNLMCSYNSINGTPACANKWLLQDILRDEFGFKGYYISDDGAIENIYTQHHFVDSPLEAAIAAAEAGINLELPPGVPVYLLLTEAVKEGRVSFETIVDRVKPLFYTRMRLGEFDPDSMNPYSQINLDQVLSPDHRQLAVDVAVKTFVLLKNDHNILPIPSTPGTMAIVGPMADNLAELYGNYASTVVPQYGYTPYQGLKGMAKKTLLAPGCSDNFCKDYDPIAVQMAAQSADVVIVCLGTGTDIEREGHDRADMNLPLNQTQLLKDAIRLAAGRPLILLLFTAGPVDISLAKSTPGVHSIVQCFFPSMSTGLALARSLFVNNGKVESPAARMPYTWPASLLQVPPMTNYSMEGRTYRYFRGPGEPLYPFGYGLSYATFVYTNLTLGSSTVKAGQNLTVMCSVNNTGLYDADEVTQIYMSWQDVTVPMPKLQLVGFTRTMVKKGSQAMLRFVITGEQMQVWDDVKKFIYQPGHITVFCGGQQPGQSTSASSNVLSQMFKIVM